MKNSCLLALRNTWVTHSISDTMLYINKDKWLSEGALRENLKPWMQDSCLLVFINTWVTYSILYLITSRLQIMANNWRPTAGEAEIINARVVKILGLRHSISDSVLFTNDDKWLSEDLLCENFKSLIQELRKNVVMRNARVTAPNIGFSAANK